MRIVQLGDFDTYVCRGLERPRELLPVRQPTGLNLVRGFKEIGGHEVHIVVTTKEVTRPTVEEGPFGIVHRLPQPPFSGSASFHLWRRALILRELARIKPDIVHGQGTEAEYAFTAVTGPYPHVITLHGIMHRVHHILPPPLLSTQHVARWLEKLVLRRARHVVCISESVASFVRQCNPRARGHLIPNAVAPCFFEFHPRSRPCGRANLLFVGTVYPLKGLHDLIEALPLVAASTGLRVELQVVGSLPGHAAGSGYVQQLRQRAGALGISSQIQWRGALAEQEVAATLAQSDLLVLPSYEETFAMCVAEAMAAGVAVVASRVGGIPNLVEDGRTGLLVPPGRVTDLAGAISSVLTDTARREPMTQKARQVARQRWSARAVATQTLALYQEVLSNPRGGTV